MKIKQITFIAYKTLIINNITLLKITFGEISLLLGIGTGLKPAPTQQEKEISLLHAIYIPQLPSEPILHIPYLPHGKHQSFLHIHLVLAFMSIVVKLFDTSFQTFRFLTVYVKSSTFVVSLYAYLRPCSGRQCSSVEYKRIAVTAESQLSLISQLAYTVE